ncbi:hypothetical protein LEP1GSC064_0985 [Leptospira kirschneri serovar Grippotyphosa str. Moskva]|nr:hypothetical protein LEP1GSC044_1309 [Leptospira kirschneri serovar Grippotyphosa str. RM52]EKQ83642.1 hypothetical protein LEP1GSC064_0985 [Leptospira kirschneri serovar Grippotyphosa str. Moskva]EKR08593.1 hypothetical protein LEP1GSC122_1330 [Leptospira kirschneri serovar Valbuzzi str. 200702274]EMK08020.1 hypothetical protein LEP1GSC176_2652 [Leptospira kirschneri str. MMD1493]
MKYCYRVFFGGRFVIGTFDLNRIGMCRFKQISLIRVFGDDIGAIVL